MDSFISNEKNDNIRNNYLRNKVKLYNGYKITSDVLKQISYIESRAVLVRNDVAMTYCNINTLYELCDLHDSEPENEFIILGDDWYISYTELPGLCAIEINDWISISNNKNTFLQTIEMISTFKQLFLGYEDCLIYAALRHSTSYNFYKFILSNEYINQLTDQISLEDEKIKKEILDEILSIYGSIEKYLLDENRKKYENEHLEDYIYHNICFEVTNKFVTKYQRVLKLFKN